MPAQLLTVRLETFSGVGGESGESGESIIEIWGKSYWEKCNNESGFWMDRERRRKKKPSESGLEVELEDRK